VFGAAGEGQLVERHADETLPAEAGLTLMTSTMSRSGRMLSSVWNGVAGLTTAPACSRARGCPARRRAGAGRFLDAPKCRSRRPGVVGDVALGVGDHQVHVERQPRGAPDRRHDRGPDVRLGTKCPSMTSRGSSRRQPPRPPSPRRRAARSPPPGSMPRCASRVRPYENHRSSPPGGRRFRAPALRRRSGQAARKRGPSRPAISDASSAGRRSRPGRAVREGAQGARVSTSS